VPSIRHQLGLDRPLWVQYTTYMGNLLHGDSHGGEPWELLPTKERHLTGFQAWGGASADEVDDPRLWSEIIRQWSTFHPEFSYLPRKFKIAVTAAAKDRAAIKVHDIGIIIQRKDDGSLGFDVYVGGGQGRTPMIGHCIGEHIAAGDLLAYLEAVMRVYNLYGRRDNIYKARIKILVHQIGAAEMKRQVEAEFAEIKSRAALELPREEIERIRRYFAAPAFEALSDESALLARQKAAGKVRGRRVPDGHASPNAFAEAYRVARQELLHTGFALNFVRVTPLHRGPASTYECNLAGLVGQQLPYLLESSHARLGLNREARVENTPSTHDRDIPLRPTISPASAPLR